MDDAFDFKVPAKEARKSYEVDYESLSQQSVERQIQKDVDHISGMFGVDVCIPILRSVRHL